MATLHEYVMARMNRNELDLLDDEEKDYFTRAVHAGLIKPPQKDIPPPKPYVDTRYDAEGYVKHSLKYGSAAWNQFSSDLAKEGKYDIFRVVPEDKGYNFLPEQHRPFPWRESPPRYKVLPKGTRMREERGWDTFRQKIGHKGPQKMTDGSGRVVSDYPYQSSLIRDGVPTLIPLITTNTTPEEMRHLLSGKEPTGDIIKGAEAFALGRIQEGLSPFYAGAGSEKLSPIRSYNALVNHDIPKSQSKIKALFRGLGEGATVEFPRMTGQALKFIGADKLGQMLVNWSDKQATTLFGSKPEYDEFTRIIYEAGKIVATSAIPGGISATGTRLLLGIGIRFKRIKEMQDTIRGLLKEHRVYKEGVKRGKGYPYGAVSKTQKGHIFNEANKRWNYIKEQGRLLKTEKESFKRIQKATIRAIGLEMATFFGMSAKETTEDTAWARIEKLERQGNYEAADAIRETLWWVPYLTGLIEATGEYFGTKYLAKLFMVSEAEILAKTSNEYVYRLLSNMFKTAGVEMGTEAGQQFGQATTEKYTDIRPDAEIWREVISVLGPAGVAALMFGGVSGVANIPRAQLSIAEEQRKQRFKATADERAIHREKIDKEFKRYQGMDDEQLYNIMENVMGLNNEIIGEYVLKPLNNNLPEDLKKAYVRHFITRTLANLSSFDKITTEKDFIRRILIESYMTDTGVELGQATIFSRKKETELMMAKSLGIPIDEEKKYTNDHFIKEIYKKYQNEYKDEYAEVVKGMEANKARRAEDNLQALTSTTKRDKGDKQGAAQNEADKIAERQDAADGPFFSMTYHAVSGIGVTPELIQQAAGVKLTYLSEETVSNLSSTQLVHAAYQQEVLRGNTFMAGVIKEAWEEATGKKKPTEEEWGKQNKKKAAEYFIKHPADFKKTVSFLVEKEELIITRKGSISQRVSAFKAKRKRLIKNDEEYLKEERLEETLKKIQNIRDKIAPWLDGKMISPMNLFYFMEHQSFIRSRDNWSDVLSPRLYMEGESQVWLSEIRRAGVIEEINHIIAKEFNTKEPSKEGKKTSVIHKDDPLNIFNEDDLTKFAARESKGKKSPTGTEAVIRRVVVRIDNMITKEGLEELFDESSGRLKSKKQIKEEGNEGRIEELEDMVRSLIKNAKDAQHGYKFLDEIQDGGWQWQAQQKPIVMEDLATETEIVTHQALIAKSLPFEAEEALYITMIHDAILAEKAAIRLILEGGIDKEVLKQAVIKNYIANRDLLLMGLPLLSGVRGQDLNTLEWASVNMDTAEVLNVIKAKTRTYSTKIAEQNQPLLKILLNKYKESYQLLLKYNSELVDSIKNTKELKKTSTPLDQEYNRHGIKFTLEEDTLSLLFLELDKTGKVQLYKDGYVGQKSKLFVMGVGSKQYKYGLKEPEYVSLRHDTNNNQIKKIYENIVYNVVVNLGGGHFKDQNRKEFIVGENEKLGSWFNKWYYEINPKTHLPRHTFTFNMYGLGYKKEQVSDMMGHSPKDKEMKALTAYGEYESRRWDKVMRFYKIYNTQVSSQEALDLTFKNKDETTEAMYQFDHLEDINPHLRALVEENHRGINFFPLLFEFRLDSKFTIGLSYDSNNLTNEKWSFKASIENLGFFNVTEEQLEGLIYRPGLAKEILSILNSAYKDTSWLKDYQSFDEIDKVGMEAEKIKKDTKKMLDIAREEDLTSKGMFTQATFKKWMATTGQMFIKHFGLSTPLNISFSEERKVVDPNSELGNIILEEHGYSKEKIDAFKKSGRKILIKGSYEAVLDNRGRRRVDIRLWYGANEETAIHEFLHQFIQEGGKAKGITEKMNINSIIDQEVAVDLLTKRVMKKYRWTGLYSFGFKINVGGITKATGEVVRLGPKLYKAAEIDTAVEIKDLSTVYWETVENNDITEGYQPKMVLSNKLIDDFINARVTNEEVADTLNKAILREEEIKARNARWIVRLGMKWWRIRKFFEFFMGMEVFTHSKFIMLVRQMKQAGISRSDKLIREWEERAKGLAPAGHRAFFDYTDGVFNDHNINDLLRALDSLERNTMEKFDEFDKINRIIAHHKEVIRILKEEKGISYTSPKIQRVVKKITAKKLERDELGMGEVTVVEKGEKNDAIVLKNPTREEFKSELDKARGPVLTAFWRDDQNALNTAVKNGLPVKFRKLAQETKELNIKMADALFKEGHINSLTYWRMYGQYVHYMYLMNLTDEAVKDLYNSPEALSRGQVEGYLLQRSNLTPAEKERYAQIKDMNIVQSVGIGQTLATLSHHDWYGRLTDPRIGAIIDFNLIPNVDKSTGGRYIIRLEMDDEHRRVYEDFLQTRLGVLTKKTVIENERVENPTPMQLAADVITLENTIKKARKLDIYTKENVKAMEKLLGQLKEAYAPLATHLKKDGLDLIKDYVVMGKNYGKLNGEYLHKIIRDDMVPLEEDSANKGEVFRFLMKYNAQATMWFKAGKVALNPPTITRNIISNLLQNNMRGRPLTHIPLDFFFALKERAAGGKYHQMAIETGIYKGTMLEAEFKDLLDDFTRTDAHKTWFRFTAFIAKKAKYYGLIDEVAKLSIFMQLMKTGPLNKWGMTTGKKIDKWEAALIAVKWGMDYSQANRSIKNLRKWLMPFVTYQYKIAPLIVESLAKRPWVIGKWAAFFGVSALSIPSIASEISKALLGISDEEWEELLKQLPDFITKNSTFIPIPIRSKEGKVMWFDLMYFMPFGTWFSVLKGLSQAEIAEVYREMGVSNPFLTVTTALASAAGGKPAKDPFTHQDIYNAVDTPLEKFHKIFSWMHNVVTPSWMENITYSGAPKKGPLPLTIDMFIHKYKGKEWRDKWDRLMGWEQVWRWFGINPYIFSERQSWAIIKAKEAYLQKQYNKKIRGLNYTEDREKIDKITEWYWRLRAKISEPKGAARKYHL